MKERRMNFYRLDPPANLQQDIRHLWSLEEACALYNSDVVIPDSTVELVINCGAPLIWHMSNGTSIHLPEIFVKGLQQEPLNLTVEGNTAQLVGISLNAWVVPTLPDIQFSSKNKSIMPLDGVWKNFAHTIIHTARHSGYTEAAYKLQQFVDHTCQRTDGLKEIQIIGGLLYETQGQIKIRELATRSHLSLSQLERRFKRLTGITLKNFARLIRFEEARNKIFSDPSAHLADLAYALGYSDQAHFAHDFRTFADCTPSMYLNRLHKHFS